MEKKRERCGSIASGKRESHRRYRSTRRTFIKETILSKASSISSFMQYICVYKVLVVGSGKRYPLLHNRLVEIRLPRDTCKPRRRRWGSFAFHGTLHNHFLSLSLFLFLFHFDITGDTTQTRKKKKKSLGARHRRRRNRLMRVSLGSR